MFLATCRQKCHVSLTTFHFGTLALATLHTANAVPTVNSRNVDVAENGAANLTISTLTKRGGETKRGVAYNDARFAHQFAFGGSKVSWAYNWDQTPNGDIAGFKYVPMLWGPADDKRFRWANNAQDAINRGWGDLLAFNEPDVCKAGDGGSCMEAGVAAEQFSMLMGPFWDKARLGAPAVSAGPQGLPWLRDFLNACRPRQCKIDFVPVHWYGDCSNPDWFKNHINDAHGAGENRMVWVTEFGCKGNSEDQIVNFFRNVLPWLDGQDFIERYSYFMARPGEMLNSDGNSLNGVGWAYATI